MTGDLGAWARTLMGAERSDDLIEYADPGRGVHRWARVSEGRLVACLFTAPIDGSSQRLPSPSWLTELLAAEQLSHDARQALLIRSEEHTSELQSH